MLCDPPLERQQLALEGFGFSQALGHLKLSGLCSGHQGAQQGLLWDSPHPPIIAGETPACDGDGHRLQLGHVIQDGPAHARGIHHQ